MQAIDIVIESEVPRTFRTSSLESVFDCPIGKKQRLEWHVEIPSLEDEWSIGMIVGPSGSGKSTVMKKAYGDPINWQWPTDKALIDAARVFDVYRGTGVPEGAKSVAVEILLQPRDKTLTDAEIETLSTKVVAAAEKAVGARLRA